MSDHVTMVRPMLTTRTQEIVDEIVARTQARSRAPSLVAAVVREGASRTSAAPVPTLRRRPNFSIDWTRSQVYRPCRCYPLKLAYGLLGGRSSASARAPS
jgi:hypothetical protein